ncbi:MAG: hypothetical protein LUE65_10750 [Clostridiales bacterium]|nr:hypothetical protein [Clostridiales bacterium]
MTRGKIIYVTKERQVYSTIEFNGDMYPIDGGHGEEIIDFFQGHGFRDIQSYGRYVKRLDNRYFGYSSVYGEKLIHFKGLSREGLFDFTENYTDYLYLINHSDTEVQMELKEGKVVLPMGALAIVHYQNLWEIIPGDGTIEAGAPGKNELVKIMENMEWDLFQRQKEWIYAQQIQIEKWYGREAAALPMGILNMIDKIQEAWEEKMARADKNPCWYEERWYDEDLKTALENAEVEVTVANVTKLRNCCVHIFDDKSVRNEMLVDMARKMSDDR